MEELLLTRVAVVAASEMTVKAFLRRHLAALARLYCVTVVVNSKDPTLLERAHIDAKLVCIPIARNISPFADFAALIRLYNMFRSGDFDLIHSVTPKAGLLATIAGRLAGVPIRLHTFTGQVWVTRSGAMRVMLKAADRLIARLATHVLVDSLSQRNFLIAQGICSEARTTVLGNGSISGVDTGRFRPNPAVRGKLRESLGIGDAETVFLYLGRLKRDKGVLDLAQAFAGCASNGSAPHLLLVGPDEESLEARIRAISGAAASRMHFAAYTDQPEDYFAAADVFCLPSYREGFGTSVLEAAAAGVPSIGSRIYGISDAIVENSTGLLFEPGNINELADKMRALGGDQARRLELGRKARERATRDFSAEALTVALLEFYERQLGTCQGRMG